MSETIDELDPELPDAAAETVEAEAVEPEAEAAVEAPAEPAGIVWDETLLNEAAARIAQLGYAITPAVTNPTAVESEQAEPEFDPFDPDSVKAYVAAQVQAERDAILAETQPVRDYVQAQQAAAEQQYLNSEVAKARTEAGYTPPGEDPAARDAQIGAMTRERFQAKLSSLPPATSPFEAATRGAVVEQLAQDALRESVQFWSEHDKQVAENAVKQYLAGFENNSNLLEPGINGAALTSEREPARSELEVAARFAQRRTAQPV